MSEEFDYSSHLSMQDRDYSEEGALYYQQMRLAMDEELLHTDAVWAAGVRYREFTHTSPSGTMREIAFLTHRLGPHRQVVYRVVDNEILLPSRRQGNFLGADSLAEEIMWDTPEDERTAETLLERARANANKWRGIQARKAQLKRSIA